MPCSRWTFVRASCTHRLVVERQPLVLRASEFQHLFDLGPTEKAYAGTPVSGLTQHEQGRLCQEWAKTVLQEKSPEAAICDPEPGTRCDGRRRGLNMTSCDFLLDGQKVDVKSAGMVYTSTGLWNVQFSRVKLPYCERKEAAFDDLYLVILSPKRLHLIEHDLVTGVCTCGDRTGLSGHTIRVFGSRRTDRWEDALEEILEKQCKRGGCSVVHERPFSDLHVQKILSERVSPGQAAVADIPMSTMSKEKRGRRLQEIGLAIDCRLHPLSDFSFAEGNRGKANVDWVRGADRVELKSCGFYFNQTQRRWQCRFYGIKPGLFDELWLAIYALVGIHYYRSKSCKSLGLCSVGAATKIHGHGLYFSALR